MRCLFGWYHSPYLLCLPYLLWLVTSLLTRGNGMLGSWPKSWCPEDLGVVLRIPIGNLGSEDRWVWHYDKVGVFSVKSGYKLLMSHDRPACCSRSHVGVRWWKALWAQRVPSKIKVFMWRAFQNILPSMTTLILRGIDVAPVCKGCFSQMETTDHALVSCKRSRAFWSLLLPNVDWRANFNQSFQDRCIV